MLKLFLSIVLFQVLSSILSSAQCPRLENDIEEKIRQYVITKFRVPKSANVALRDIAFVESTCYRKLTFQSDATPQPLILYLSPDAHFLAPGLYDLTTDPLTSEKRQAGEVLKLLTAEKSPFLGSESALVNIVEFGDFECPYCKHFADLLEKDYLPGNKDSVRIVYKHFPLRFHGWAHVAAEAAACAGFQRDNAFWQVHDFLFSNQGRLTSSNIKEKLTEFVKSKTDIDAKQFVSCISLGDARAVVRRDLELGEKIGVEGTPTVFINGIRITGIRTAPELNEWIQRASEDIASAVSPGVAH